MQLEARESVTTKVLKSIKSAANQICHLDWLQAYAVKEVASLFASFLPLFSNISLDKNCLPQRYQHGVVLPLLK
jgi:hypothetical protein